MSQSLTPRQEAILRFIIDHEKKVGYPPSIREICERFGIASPRGAVKHLEALEKKGYIERAKGISRGITVLANAYDRFELERQVMIPVVGVIAAGEALEAVEAISEHVPVAEGFLKKGFEYYALKVRGDSMIDEHILHGDYVIMRKQNWADNGDIVAALIDNSYATLKRYYRKEDMVTLKPANAQMEPILVEANRVTIQGKLVGVIRWIG